MRCPGPLGYILSGSAVLALLAGCSGGGGSSLSPASLTPQGSSTLSSSRSLDSFDHQAPKGSSVARVPAIRAGLPNMTASFADPAYSQKGAVIVSDAANGVVDVYSTAHKLIATISGLSEPQGLAGETNGNFFIANTSASDILEYKNDYKTLVATLADPNQFPAGVGVDSTTGVVGVTNIISTAGGAGSVSFYAKGAKSPCTTVSNSSFSRVYFGAFDDAGDFYVDGSDANGAVLVGVAKGECKAKTISLLTTKNTISFPGGIQVTNGDQISIGDQSSSPPNIYTYKAPTGSSLGSPVSTTPLTGSSDPVTYSFVTTNTKVWTADAGLAAANKFAFPAGGSPILSISIPGSQPIGVVVTPLEQP